MRVDTVIVIYSLGFTCLIGSNFCVFRLAGFSKSQHVNNDSFNRELYEECMRELHENSNMYVCSFTRPFIVSS
jgi:hypothetical protein